MNKVILSLLFTAMSLTMAKDESLQPYILIGETGKSVESTIEDIIGSFFMKDKLEILGKYSPMNDPDRYVIVVTNSDLLKAVKKGKPIAGFAAVIRIAITRQGEMTYVSCQNPEYWGNAYYQDDYPSVEENILAFREILMKSFPKMRIRFNRQFGSGKNKSAIDLRHYRYMFGMEYFEDTIQLGEFSNYNEAVKTIEKNLKSSEICKKVFEKKIPGKNVKLYGIGLNGEKGEGHFLPIIDVADKKHTASLPFEILVIENQVHMMHGRFRIAVGFPDLKMMTFRKIMSTPGDIEKMMKSLME